MISNRRLYSHCIYLLLADNMKPFIRLAFLLTLTYIFGCQRKPQQANCTSKDIELIDTCLLGSTIEEAINRLELDTSHFIPILFSAREVSGIYVRLSDTCKITIIVEKPFILTNGQLKAIETNGWLNSHWKSIHKYILDYKIIGICWRKNFARKVRKVGNMKYHDCWDY